LLVRFEITSGAVIPYAREQNPASTSCGHHVDQAVDVPL